MKMFMYRTKERTPFLSKSRFLKGLQCHKALWLLTQYPELQDKLSPSQQAIFDTSAEVGKLAQNLFPGGVEIPFDGLTISQQLAMTQAEIKKGTETIYEAAFSFDGVFIKIDILCKFENGWELYEVKGSTEAKEVYLNDIAVQYHVAAGTGLKVNRAALVHIDNSYVRQGDIDVHKLFTIQDVTEEILSKQPFVAVQVQAMKAMLTRDVPVIDIGPQCSDPYACSFHGHCWAHIPSPSVFDFADVGKPDAFDLYRKGIVKMKDVPREILGWRQQLQLDGVLYRKNHFDAEAIQQFLQSLWYPLAFMDFETTCLTPVPLFDGTRPFQPVPFQFSLHLQEAKGSPVKHFEFLADGKGDPQRPFIKSLLRAIPDGACVLAWNKSFEARILKELAAGFPEHGARINEIIESLVDLMVPFRRKDIYHWQFGGSYSIKAVLPALVPELSYAALEISDGGTAANTWLQMRETSDTMDYQRMQLNLLAYCHLDTLAMVEILGKIGEVGKFAPDK
jgi:hypothetical protein